MERKKISLGKKADLEIRYLILMILAVLVLVVIALIFSKQITAFLGKLKIIWDNLWSIAPEGPIQIQQP